MKNKVHYGEFTLDYWIRQLVTAQIELPEYQRSFVWSKNQVFNLMKSMTERQFVPPVTIGVIGGRNIIIDGQQRLTSILLAHLNLFPSQKAYMKTIKKEGDEEGEIEEEIFFKWTVREIQQEHAPNLKGLRDRLLSIVLPDGSPAYENLGLTWADEQWLKKNYLGFSYIVPAGNQNDDVQYKFYSSIFRNINIGGIPLRNDESREAMYYLRKPFVPLFKPQFIQTYTVTQIGEKTPIDFLRVLGIVSQYAKNKKEGEVLKNYSGLKRLEDFLMKFISAVLDDNDELFKKFSDMIPLPEIEQRMAHLAQEFAKLNLPNNFSGIIDTDNYLFGLVYYCLLEGKSIKDDQVDSLKAEILNNIRKQKKDEKHAKGPNQLRHIRKRLSQSLSTFKKYVY